MATYKRGDRVHITRGKYSSYGSGTFLSFTGMVSAQIKVDGDSKNQRTVRLKSIEKMKPTKNTTNIKEETSTNNGKITIDKAEYDAIIKAIENLKIRVERLNK
jgi:hypothetical protein